MGAAVTEAAGEASRAISGSLSAPQAEATSVTAASNAATSRKVLRVFMDCFPL